MSWLSAKREKLLEMQRNWYKNKYHCVKAMLSDV